MIKTCHTIIRKKKIITITNMIEKLERLETSQKNLIKCDMNHSIIFLEIFYSLLHLEKLKVANKISTVKINRENKNCKIPLIEL